MLRRKVSFASFCFALCFGGKGFGAVPETEQEQPMPPSLMKGCSLSFVLPNGGGYFGTGAIGGRCALSERMALGVSVQGGFDKASEVSAFGIGLRPQYFLAPVAKSQPYFFLQLSAGQNKNTKEKTTENVAAAMAGFGVEVFFIPEFSLSGDVGVGTNFAPSEKLNVTTVNSALAAHIHF